MPLPPRTPNDASPDAIRRRVGRPWHLALLVAGSIAVVYALFALLQATWFADAPMPALHRLFIVRGVTSSVTVAILIARFLLKTTPPLMPRAAAEQNVLLESSRGRRERRRIDASARWFIQMRWLAVLAAGTLAWLSVRVLHLLPGAVLVPLLATVAMMAVFNLLVWRLVQKETAGTAMLTVQVYVDLIALNVLLHFAGGVENPLYILAVFHVMIAGILLRPVQCFAVGASAGLLFSLLLAAEWGGLLDHYTLRIVPHGVDHSIHAAHEGQYVVSVAGILCGALLLTGYFVTRLAEQIRADERVLEGLASDALAERRLLENALATTATGIRRLDARLAPCWANDQWTRWFGAEDSPARPALLAAARETARDGRVRTTEVTTPAGGEAEGLDGERYFRVTSAPLRDHEGRIREVVELVQEVTRQKAEQRRLIRTKQLALVGELASHVAHEVNNPVAIMGGKARLLLSKFGARLPGMVRRDLETIVDLCDRVAGIASGLLSYARPAAGVRRRIDIQRPIERALDLVRQRSGTGRVRVETAFEEDLPPVHANAPELEQVFLNLFLNAIDAMPEGGVLSVRGARCRGRAGDEVAVKVVDTGAGIAAEPRHRIFEPFFSTKENGKGTGLGLSICQGIVTSHGGSIAVDSEAGRGSAFTVRLPAAAGDAQEQGDG